MGKINSIPNEPRFSAFYDEFTVVTGNAISVALDVTNQRYGFYAYQNTSAQNDETTIKFNFAPGTYTLYILGLINIGNAISTISIDGVSQGTLDWYNASLVYNSTKTMSVVINSNTVHSLNIKAATKNPSANNFNLILTKIWIK